jgi:hypothetical protein
MNVSIFLEIRNRVWIQGRIKKGHMWIRKGKQTWGDKGEKKIQG